MTLSLIIPCYNEEKNIPLIFARLSETLGNRQDVDIVLVNNGSTDHSAEIMNAELAKMNNPHFTIHSIQINQGYGYGILSGLEKVQGKVLAWTHADMQTDPKDALSAYDLYMKSGDEKIIVKGKRRNRSILETVFTFGMQLIASMALGVVLDDINAQPKLFSRSFYEKFLLGQAPHDFSLDLFLLYQAQKQKYKILTIPVFFAKRLHGEAKGGGSWKTRLKLMRRTLAYIFELRSRLKHS